MKIARANRLDAISEYYFSERGRYIKSLEAKGHQVINLGIGSPDLSPDPSVLLALEQSSKEGNDGYQPYNGTLQLRNGIEEYLSSFFDVSLRANDEILPLIGSKEGILHISLAYLNPGDKVLVPELGYPAYTAITKMVGAEVVIYPLTEKWEPDWQEIYKMDTEGAKLMWLNYPHMPTGAAGNLNTFEKAVAFGKDKNVLICHDNPYAMILNDHPLSIFKVEGSKDICLELHSLSKSHNMAGWRIGWVAGNSEIIDNILKVNSNIHSGMYRGIQDAAITALSLHSDWHRQRDTIYSKRKEYAIRIMEELNCSVNENTQGLFVWGKLPEGSSSAMEVTEKLLDEKFIFITPGFIFGEKGSGYLRISLCASEEKFKTALNRIRQ